MKIIKELIGDYADDSIVEVTGARETIKNMLYQVDVSTPDHKYAEYTVGSSSFFDEDNKYKSLPMVIVSSPDEDCHRNCYLLFDNEALSSREHYWRIQVLVQKRSAIILLIRDDLTYNFNDIPFEVEILESI